MPEPKLVYLLNVKVDGSDLSHDEVSQIRWLTIDSSLHIPDMFIIHFEEIHADNLDALLSKFDVGKSIAIGLSNDQDAITSIFDGEVTALEPTFANNAIALDVRGYDKAHRLHRATKSKAFLNVTDSDIVTQVAGAAGLQADVDSTSVVYKHVFQDALTDFQFLVERAERIGYILFTENGKLKFKKPTAPSSPDMTLKLDEQLMSFSPRLTLAAQVDTVNIRGWDIAQKQAIVGQANSSNSSPSVGAGSSGGSAAQTAFGGAAARMDLGYIAQDTSDANNIAQGILDSVNSSYIEATGKASGVPTLHAGMVVKIEGVGTKFSGKYGVTTVHHEYAAGDYETTFNIEGRRPDLLSDIVGSGGNGHGRTWPSVVSGIVTNNVDPDDYGRVKLKFPWMDDTQESTWARLVVAGGGNQRGSYFFPEVNDEVLVAFEQGDINRPYVIGGLYNGQDKPALTNGDAVKSGKVARRVIMTRTGHKITFVDEDGGDDYIEIMDDKSNTSLKFDAANKKITMDSKGDIEVKSMGNLTMTAQQDITIKTDSGNVTIQGLQVAVKGQTQVDVKSDAGPVNVQGLVTAIKAQTEASLEGSVMAKIQGAIVMIN